MPNEEESGFKLPPPKRRARRGGIRLDGLILNAKNAKLEGLKNLVHNTTKKQESKFNFEAHGKKYAFAKNSLYCFPDTSEFRQKLVNLVTSKFFPKMMLFLVALNTTLLCFSDFKPRVGLEATWPEL